MRHSLTLNVTGMLRRPGASVSTSLRLGQEVLQGAYRRHVFKKNMALRFDALADAIAIFTVPDEFDRKRNVVFLRSGYQLLESHSLQDAARQPAAQKPPFPSHDRAPLLHRLHCGVEAGEADGVQENIGTLEQSVKRRAVQPGNEDHVFIEVQAVVGENGFKS